MKTPDNYIPRKIVYRKIKTGYELKKILCNITDYKTVHELNNFYKTKWVPLNWLQRQIKLKHKDFFHTKIKPTFYDGLDWVLSLLKKQKG